MKPINLKNVDSKASIIKIESHPAERKNSSVTVGSVCCSTCCCCCCCLHSAGGIVGAAIMSRNVLKSQPTVLANQTPYQAMSPYQKQTYPATQNQAPNYEELLKEHKSSIKTALQIYWLLLVPTIFLPALLGEVAFLLTLIALPIAQMGLSAFVIILINILPIADRKAATNAMLKILAGAFVGSIIGLFLLSILGIVLTF